MELLNKHKHGTPRGSIYIGRGSPFGNPYRIGEHGTREEVIEKYKGWLTRKLIDHDPEVTHAMKSLNADSKLLCFCHPAPCHGSVIDATWQEIMDNGNGDFATGLRNFRNKRIQSTEEEYRRYLVEKLVCRDADVTVDFREQILSQHTIPERFRCCNVTPIMVKLHTEIMAQQDYDQAIADLAKREGMVHLPNLDGITHINVYSKGQTKLGRGLSNFAHTPFDHPKDGHCESVEGYWYYLKSGREFPYLKTLWGNEAKQEGKRYPRVESSDFLENIKEAITCKILQTPELLKDFRESTLPFSHYYWYGSIFNPRVLAKDADKWMVDHLEELRSRLKQE